MSNSIQPHTGNSDEIKFLKRLVKLEDERDSLQTKLNNTGNNSRDEAYINRLAIVDSDIENIKTELSLMEDKSGSEKARTLMAQQLDAYIAAMESRPGKGVNLKISRNQSFGIKNYLFSKISEDLRYLVSGRISGYSIPTIYTTTCKEDEVSNIKLIAFLQEEIHRIENIQAVDFNKLRDYHTGFWERMAEKFIM